MQTLISPACTFATDRQRFDPAQLPPEPASELWHQTTFGSAVSRGFVLRGTDNAVIDEARRRMREAPSDGPTVTYHLVAEGSYDGWPEPSLGQHNRIDPGPTLAEMGMGEDADDVPYEEPGPDKCGGYIGYGSDRCMRAPGHPGEC